MTKYNHYPSNPKKVVLPVPPLAVGQDSDLEIYARFMRHLRMVPISRMEIKILSSIEFTADLLDLSDAHVAKVLIDLGLRAPEAAFPADFLIFAERCLRREGWVIGGPNDALRELGRYWAPKTSRQITALKSSIDYADPRILVSV